MPPEQKVVSSNLTGRTNFNFPHLNEADRATGFKVELDPESAGSGSTRLSEYRG